MDFWIIVGIVFLSCALINLPYFVMELREERRKKQEADCGTVLRKQLPDGSFTLEYHFQNRLKTNLNLINVVLAEYELSKLEIVQYHAYLATETETDAATGKQAVNYWYGLDDITLRCTPAKPGEGQSFRISTMTAAKSVQDCALLWQENNPGRKLYSKVFQEYEPVHALIFIHHALKPGTEKRKSIQRSGTPQAKTIQMPSKQPAPVQSDSLTWRLEEDTLYIDGKGEVTDSFICGIPPFRNVVLGPGISRIGIKAFDGCTNLASITIADSVEAIGMYAFRGCTGLTSVTIPDSVRRIRTNAFRGCTNLTHIAIPDSVREIGVEAFCDCNNLTSIKLPDGIDKIVDRTFSGCSALTGIVIPASVREIGPMAFSDCTGLTSVTIPDGVRVIGPMAFSDCTGLTSVTIPDGVRVIDKAAFSGCSGLTDLALPDSVREIGPMAFSGCTALASITVPANVSIIGNNAFRDVPHIYCSGALVAADFWGADDAEYVQGRKFFCGRPGKDTLSWHMVDDTLYIEGQGRLRCSRYNWNKDDVRHVIIAPGCTAIADFVFQNHSNLESVVLPDTLRTIGERAFSGCAKLRDVNIPDSVIGIGKGTFSGCRNLEKVHLPKNLTQIHTDTFYKCVSLENVQIPDCVHYIGSHAFYRVKSVNNLPLNLGNWGTKTLGYSKRRYGLGVGAFDSAGLPAHIEIPAMVYIIPEGAFADCKSLVSVKFPRYVAEIGQNAFFGCSQLECLEIPKTVREIGGYAFYGIPHIIYHGPAQSDDNWGALSRN